MRRRERRRAEVTLFAVRRPPSADCPRGSRPSTLLPVTGIDPPVVDLRWAVARAAPRPSSYRAHGMGPQGDLPLPLEVFLFAAGLILVVAFAVVATRQPQDRPEEVTAESLERPMERPSRAAEIIGVGGLVLVVVAGIAGVDNPSRNLAPVLVNVLFWLGLPLEIVFGDLYASLNPWRALAQWTGLGEAATRPKWSASAFGRLPSGTWSLCGYRWCLRSGAWRRPSGGGGRAHRCAARVGCGRRPREALRIADPFTTYNAMAGGISPLGKDESGGRKGVARPADTHGIATGSWRIRRGDDRSGVVGWVLLHPVVVGDDGQRRRLSGTWDAGVVDHVGSCVGGAIPRIRLCRPQRVPSLDDDQGLCPGAGAIGPGGDARPPPPVLLFEGQLLLSTISDPLGVGWDLFGTADHKIAFFATRHPVVVPGGGLRQRRHRLARGGAPADGGAGSPGRHGTTRVWDASPHGDAHPRRHDRHRSRVISRLPVVLLHQGGWDEILMFALPALATIWLLRRAERRRGPMLHDENRSRKSPATPPMETDRDGSSRAHRLGRCQRRNP